MKEDPLVNFLNKVIAGITLIGNLIIIVILAFGILLTSKKIRGSIGKKILTTLGSNGLTLAFIVTTLSGAGSLYFSDIAGFAPCRLCWYQRIFMFPQVIILGIAMLKNDYSVKKYLIPLSLIGAAIALYQFLLQLFPNALPSCAGDGASCATKYINYLGFINIPFMSLTAFLLITLFLHFQKENKQ